MYCVLSPWLILKQILKLVYKALSLEKTWEGLSLYFPYLGTGQMNSLVPLTLVCRGPEYPDMEINIDLMPIFKLRKWPPGYLRGECYLIPQTVRKSGCAVVIKGSFSDRTLIVLIIK